jgi:hypothetical protein
MNRQVAGRDRTVLLVTSSERVRRTGYLLVALEHRSGIGRGTETRGDRGDICSFELYCL